MVLSRISTKNLLTMSAVGAIGTTAFAFYTQNVIVRRQGSCSYYRNAITVLRNHPGAQHMLGTPIRDTESWNLLDLPPFFWVPKRGKDQPKQMKKKVIQRPTKNVRSFFFWETIALFWSILFYLKVKTLSLTLPSVIITDRFSGTEIHFRRLCEQPVESSAHSAQDSRQRAQRKRPLFHRSLSVWSRLYFFF